MIIQISKNIAERFYVIEDEVSYDIKYEPEILERFPARILQAVNDKMLSSL